MTEFVREDGVTHVAQDYISGNGNGNKLSEAGLLQAYDFGTIEGFDPYATTDGNIHATVTLTASPQTISTGFTQPAKPRSVFIRDIDGVGAGIFTFHGKDSFGNALSETVDLSTAPLPPQTLNAFSEIDSIDCPASDGNHFNFSTGTFIGFDFVDANPIIGIPTVDGVSQVSNPLLSTVWTMTALNDATHVSLNGYVVPNNSTFLGGHVKFYFITK